jgi:hypothetical protein
VREGAGLERPTKASTAPTTALNIPNTPIYGGGGYEVRARLAKFSRWRQVAKASVPG